jgi:thiamine-phosphate pyrophosphorylase
LNAQRSFVRSSLWLCADLASLDAATLIDRSEAIVRRAASCGLPSSRLALWLRSLSVVSSRAGLEFARAMRAMTDAHRAHLVIGARPDLALLCGADAVHVTHSGPSARDVERLIDAESAPLVMTAAVHDPAEAREFGTRCEVLLASPFAHVPQKNAPLGVAGLSAIVSAAPARAVIALGGIDSPAAVHSVIAAGARGIAARRALLSSDPAEAMAPLLAALAAHIA